MNRTEAEILSKVTKAVARHNKYLWWELKRQIFDCGEQAYYPRQGEYDLLAQRAVSQLPLRYLDELRAAYIARFPNEAHIAHERLIHHYAMVVVEEVARRARIAAYRTINW